MHTGFEINNCIHSHGYRTRIVGHGSPQQMSGLWNNVQTHSQFSKQLIFGCTLLQVYFEPCVRYCPSRFPNQVTMSTHLIQCVNGISMTNILPPHHNTVLYLTCVQYFCELSMVYANWLFLNYEVLSGTSFNLLIITKRLSPLLSRWMQLTVQYVLAFHSCYVFL